MSAHEPVYSFGVAYPDYLERGRAQTVSLSVRRSGSLVEPSAGTFYLYDSTDSLLVSGLVSVVDSIATYPVLAATLPATLPYGAGYREEWALTLEGVERTIPRPARLVRAAAYPVISDSDILSVYNDLANQRRVGNTTWQEKIDEGWRRVLSRLEGAGIFPEQIVDSWMVRELHLEITLYLVCQDYHRRQGGHWAELAVQHAQSAERRWKDLRFRLDRDQDGVADDGDLHSATSGVTYVGGAPATGWGGYGGFG